MLFNYLNKTTSFTFENEPFKNASDQLMKERKVIN